MRLREPIACKVCKHQTHYFEFPEIFICPDCVEDVTSGFVVDSIDGFIMREMLVVTYNRILDQVEEMFRFMRKENKE